MLGAAIDVGSNTVRLLVGESSGPDLVPHHYFRRITRLAGGFDPATGLTEAAMARTLDAIAEIAQLLKEHPVAGLRMVGTEMLRRAPNAGALCAAIAATTGLRLEIIPGAEEARLSAFGARSALSPLPQTYLLFDIGGGSSEFTLQHNETIACHRSFPLGVVALAECFPNASARQAEIRSTLATLRNELEQAALLPLVLQAQTVFIGTAGTVTTLAALQLQMATYDWRKINNLSLTTTELCALQQSLLRLSPLQRLSLPGLEPGREDLIVPGLEIVLALLQTFAKSELKVSDFGLLEGLLLSLSPASRCGTIR